MPCGNKQMLTSYVTREEYDGIKKAAGQAKISVSKFVRQVCLGHELKSKVDHEAVLALLQANSDLSRLGNLLKLALDQSTVDKEQVSELIDSIQEMKSLLNEKVKAI